MCCTAIMKNFINIGDISKKDLIDIINDKPVDHRLIDIHLNSYNFFYNRKYRKKMLVKILDNLYN